ncbi:hypothetical protein [Spirosoma linguale]|uniref:Uncharacterized protein n=1 Tax=Spirosoma linguale (strain ATCC 33905 / DSM 74 / LMG 10896 / Claus 1) TaxID=504472 RepID=D2QRH9_SPILD|nr:hypothetical protein Slin_4906 [Spirosoma linguale DSM 74]
METNQQPAPVLTPSELARHERAWGIIRRLVDDKRQAEKDIVDNFHTDPLIQAAVAKLKEENERRGTAVVPL